MSGLHSLSTFMLNFVKFNFKKMFKIMLKVLNINIWLKIVGLDLFLTDFHQIF